MHFLVFQCSLYIIIDLNSLLNHWLRLKRRVVSERPSERVLARYSTCKYDLNLTRAVYGGVTAQ